MMGPCSMKSKCEARIIHFPSHTHIEPPVNPRNTTIYANTVQTSKPLLIVPNLLQRSPSNNHLTQFYPKSTHVITPNQIHLISQASIILKPAKIILPVFFSPTIVYPTLIWKSYSTTSSCPTEKRLAQKTKIAMSQQILVISIMCICNKYQIASWFICTKSCIEVK